MRVPADALQLAKLIRGVAEGALARRPPPCEHLGAVVEELELDGGRVGNLPDLGIDPRVVLADPPDALRSFADQRSTLNAHAELSTFNAQLATLDCKVSRATAQRLGRHVSLER